MSLVLRGPTGQTRVLADGLFIGRGDVGLSSSTRISRKHLQILRIGSGGDVVGRGGQGGGRWEVRRKGANAVKHMRGNEQRDVDKMSGVEIRAGDSLVLATKPGERPDPTHKIDVVAAAGDAARHAARPPVAAAVLAGDGAATAAAAANDDDAPLAFGSDRSPPRKRARRLSKNSAADRQPVVSGRATTPVGGGASATVDLTSSPIRRPRQPHRKLESSGSDSDDDVIVVRTVKGTGAPDASGGDDVIVVGESRETGSELAAAAAAAASAAPAAEEEGAGAAGAAAAAGAPAAATAAASSGAAAAPAPKVRRGLTRKRPFDCPICMMDCEPDEGYTLSCTHSFCAACVGQYVAIKVKDGEIAQQQLVCPAEDCKAPLSAFDVEGVLTHAENGAELWSKFDEFRLTRYVEQEETSHHCPGAGCGYMFFVAPADRDRQPRFDCPQCSGSFCIKCKEKWHEGSCPVPEDESMTEYLLRRILVYQPKGLNRDWSPRFLYAAG